MNYKIIFLFLSVITITSCTSKNINLRGNWSNCYDAKMEGQRYVEIFYGKEFFYIYKPEAGLTFGGSYNLENEKFYFDDVKDSFVTIKKTSPDKIVLFYNDTLRYFLKRIKKSSASLDLLVTDKISGNEFYTKGYLARKASWKKSCNPL